MKTKRYLTTAAILLTSSLSAFAANSDKIPGATVQDAAFFTGKPYDADLESYVFNYRNYNAEAGRWTTADPSGFPDGANANIYAASPTSGFDPDGRTAHHAFNSQAHTISMTVAVYDPTNLFGGQSVLNGWAASASSVWAFSGTDATNKQNLSFSINVTFSLLGGQLSPSQILNSYDDMVIPTGAGSRSNVQNYRQGFWARNIAGLTVAHEIGHFIGADDKYRDNLQGTVSTPFPEWENTLMGGNGSGGLASHATKKDVNLMLTTLGLSNHLFE